VKRKLVFFVPGATFTTTVEHDQAELVLSHWRQVQNGDESAQNVLQVDGTPVFHIALDSVMAITDQVP